jgi:flagella basal body P-ring formation protein FlgA
VVRDTYLNGGGTLYPSDLDNVIGKRLKRDMPSGAVVTNQALEDRPILKKGDLVTILAENGRLVVRAKGTTMEKGKVGDTIRVKNVSSGREVMGKVLNSSTIAVHF